MMCTCLVKFCAVAGLRAHAIAASARRPANVARDVGMDVSPQEKVVATVAPAPERSQTVLERYLQPVPPVLRPQSALAPEARITSAHLVVSACMKAPKSLPVT